MIFVGIALMGLSLLVLFVGRYHQVSDDAERIDGWNRRVLILPEQNVKIWDAFVDEKGVYSLLATESGSTCVSIMSVGDDDALKETGSFPLPALAPDDSIYALGALDANRILIVISSLHELTITDYFEESKCFISSRNGSLEEVTIPISDEVFAKKSTLASDTGFEDSISTTIKTSNKPADLTRLSNGTFLVRDYRSAYYVMDSNFNLIQGLGDINPDMYVTSCVEYHGSLMMLIAQANGQTSEHHLAAYDLDTYQEVDVDELLEEWILSRINTANGIEPILFTPDDGNSIGLYSTDISLLDGDDTDIIPPISSLPSVLPISSSSLCLADVSGSYFVFGSGALGQAETSIYRLTRTGTNNVVRPSFSIYALKDSMELRQMISRYQHDNPDSDIELEIGIEDDDHIAVDDEIRRLNLRLLGGNGPDVIVLDGLPIEAYENWGVLADLSELEMNEDGYFEKIVTCFQQGSRIPALPTSFTFYAMLGTREAEAEFLSVWNSGAIEDDLASNRSGVASTSILSVTDLLSLFYPAIIDEGSIDRESLNSLFASIEYQVQSGFLDSSTIDFSSSQAAAPEAGAERTALSGHRILLGRVPFEVGCLSSCASFASMKLAMQESDSDLLFTPLCAEGNSLFIPMNVLGVSADSDQIAEAMDFVSYCISADEQSKKQHQGLPVSKTAFAEILSSFSGYTLDAGGGRIAHSDSLTDEEIEGYIAIIDSLSTMSFIDSTIASIVINQADDLASERIDREGAVTAAAGKMRLYLAEQN